MQTIIGSSPLCEYGLAVRRDFDQLPRIGSIFNGDFMRMDHVTNKLLMSSQWCIAKLAEYRWYVHRGKSIVLMSIIELRVRIHYNRFRFWNMKKSLGQVN
jgi:hypothetical protein